MVAAPFGSELMSNLVLTKLSDPVTLGVCRLGEAKSMGSRDENDPNYCDLWHLLDSCLQEYVRQNEILP